MREPPSLHATRWSVAALGGLFAIILALLRLLPGEPIYTDEIAYLILHGRAFYDGLNSSSLYPQCHSLAFPVPATFIPLFFVSGVAQTAFVHDELTLKLVSSLGGMLLVWGFSYFYWQLFLKEFPLFRVLCEAVLPLFCGTLPFVLALNRPEQLISLYLITLIYLALISKREDQPFLSSPVFPILLLGLHAYAFALHPKVLFFLPIIVICTWLSIQKTSYRWGALVLTGFIATNSVQHYSKLFDFSFCPLVAEKFTHHTIRLLEGSLQLGPIVSKLQEDFLSFIYFFIQVSIDWKASPTSTSSRIFDEFELGIHSWILVAIYIVGLVQIAIATWGAVSNALKTKSVSKEQLLLALLCTSSIATLFANQKRFFYEAGLYLPIFYFSLGLAWRSSTNNISRLLRRAYCWLIMFASVPSIFILVSNDNIRLFESTRQVFRRLYFSPQQLEYPIGVRDEILARCGFDKSLKSYRHLLLSEDTYLAFRQSREPFLTTYVTDPYWSSDIRDLRTFLNQHGSDGIIANCNQLPSDFQSSSLRIGGICCARLSNSTKVGL